MNSAAAARTDALREAVIIALVALENRVDDWLDNADMRGYAIRQVGRMKSAIREIAGVTGIDGTRYLPRVRRCHAIVPKRPLLDPAFVAIFGWPSCGHCADPIPPDAWRAGVRYCGACEPWIDEARCIVCGCTDSRACDEGGGLPCRWSAVDREAGAGVCSRCASREQAFDLLEHHLDTLAEATSSGGAL